MLGEVLDHVVAFGLAMDQNIQSHLFLAMNNRGDLVAEKGFVALFIELTSARSLTCVADLRSLRKRSDGCRRQLREFQNLGLLMRAMRVVGAPYQVVGCDCIQLASDTSAVHQR